MPNKGSYYETGIWGETRYKQLLQCKRLLAKVKKPAGDEKYNKIKSRYKSCV